MTLYHVATAMGPTFDRKRTGGRCVVLRCSRAAAPGRHTCHTFRNRAWRSKHPEHHLWNNLKKSAKRRGHGFTLTIAEWLTFCREHDFVAKVGRAAGSATIDRIDSTQGYSARNIRILSNQENAAKGNMVGPYSPEEDPLTC